MKRMKPILNARLNDDVVESSLIVPTIILLIRFIRSIR